MAIPPLSDEFKAGCFPKRPRKMPDLPRQRDDVRTHVQSSAIGLDRRKVWHHNILCGLSNEPAEIGILEAHGLRRDIGFLPGNVCDFHCSGLAAALALSRRSSSDLRSQLQEHVSISSASYRQLRAAGGYRGRHGLTLHGDVVVDLAGILIPALALRLRASCPELNGPVTVRSR